MSNSFTFLRGAAAALLLTTQAMAQDAPTAETVVATVNGTDITLGQMIAVRRGLPAQYSSTPDDILFTGILDQLVQQELLSQSLGSDIPKGIEIEVNNTRRILLASEAVNQILDANVDDAAIQAAYDAQYSSFEGSREYNASHILVATQEEAAAIAEDIRAGADFATTAQEKSTGPSGPSGGELGWFGTGRMVAPFEEAVVAMEVGDVSDPVETQFGWHVIKLNDSRLTEAPALEAVRAQIEEQVQAQVIESEIARLTDAGEVDQSAAEGLDPAILKSYDILEK